MFETYLTVIGNVVNKPDRRATPAGDVVSFRMGSTTRYWSGEENRWRDGGSVFLTVSCWKRLVTGVGAAVMKGSPVIAHGPVRLREYVTADGEPRRDLEMRAVSVGLDLARCITQRVDAPRGPRPEERREGAEDAGADADADAAQRPGEAGAVGAAGAGPGADPAGVQDADGEPEAFADEEPEPVGG